MLKYFAFLTLALTLTGLVFRSYFLYYFSDEAGHLIYAWLWGLRFDLAIAVVWAFLATSLSAVFHKNQKVSRYISCFFICFTLFMLIGDAIFFLDSGRHATYEAKSFFTSFTELVTTGFKTPPIFLVIVTFLFPFAAWHFSPKMRLAKNIKILEIFIILVVTVFAFRGLDRVPQNPSFAYKLGDSHKSIVAMNGAFGFLHGLFSSKNVARIGITLPQDVDTKAIVEDYLQKTQRSPRPPVKANVVFILLEGWPARFLKSYGAEIDGAPFFDSLRKKSLSPEATFAGGLRTTEGIFANFCAWVNPLGRSIAKSQLEAKPYNCLPHLMREQGWSSAFFQGTTKETSGTGELAQRVGFENSYGKYEVPDFKNLPKSDWGIFDRDIYKFVLSKTSEMKEPFIVGINTNSTHSTDIPPYDTANTFGCTDTASCYLSVFATADRDLEKFFAEYNNVKRTLPTIWVLVADHTSKEEQRSRIDGFRVPMLIYAPELIDSKTIALNSKRPATQRDLGITVAHLLGLDTKHMLGRSLLDAAAPVRADYFHQGVLAWLIDNRIYELAVFEGHAVGCYDWRRDTAQKNNLLDTDEECKKNKKMAEHEGLAIIDWSQEKLFSGTIGK